MVYQDATGLYHFLINVIPFISNSVESLEMKRDLGEYHRIVGDFKQSGYYKPIHRSSQVVHTVHTVHPVHTVQKTVFIRLKLRLATEEGQNIK